MPWPATSRSGRIASSASDWSPNHAATMAITGWPTTSAGTNGAGGASRVTTAVPSMSGAVSTYDR